MPPPIVSAVDLPTAEPFVAPVPWPVGEAEPLPAARRREPMFRPARPPAGSLQPETVHPSLWRAHQLGRQAEAMLPSGFSSLDAQLPGGGWPKRVLTELLLSDTGVGEVRLMAPSLATVQRTGRLVMLFDPPAMLSGWALARLGLDVAQLLVIQTRGPDESGETHRPAARSGIHARLWALEQALKSGHVGAVVAWLPPRLAAERVRRLQLAAHAHDGPAFMLRDRAAQQQPSAAPLRLALKPVGVDRLGIHLVKRRGPPLDQMVCLDLAPVLSTPADRRFPQGPVREEARQAMRLPIATFVNLA